MLQSIANPYLNDSGGTTFTFDGAGRQTESDQAGLDHYGNGYDVTNSRTYDAENHVLSSAQSSPYNFYQSISHIDNTLTSYQWGPNGHPIRIGSTPAVANAQPTTSQLAYDTLHWDGGQLLFTTNAAGQVDDIKVGSIGDITPLDSGYSGLTFYDRVAGAIAFCHNATGAGGNNKQNAQHSQLFGTNPATSPCKTYGTQVMSSPASVVWGSGNIAGGVGQGKVLGTPGTDGITDGANTIQGVRSYDSVQGQWTTPDAYAGDVQDPASQKSYMWNKGNAAAYSDPSGYDSASTSLTYAGYGAQSGDAAQDAPDSASGEIDSDGFNGRIWGGSLSDEVAALIGRQYSLNQGAQALQGLGEYAVWAVLMNEHATPDAFHAVIYTHFLEKVAKVLTPDLQGWKSTIKDRQLTFALGNSSLTINVHDGYVGIHTIWKGKLYGDYSFLQFRWMRNPRFSDASVWKADAWGGLDNWHAFNGSASAKIEGAD